MSKKIKPTIVGTAVILAYTVLSYFYMLFLIAVAPEFRANIEGTMETTGMGFLLLSLTISLLIAFIMLAKTIGEKILEK